jgi:hypothetical protein
MAVDADGNIIAAGFFHDRDFGQQIVVIKLRPDSSTVWISPIAGQHVGFADVANTLLVLKNNDVVVAGAINNAFAVLRLDGNTGAILLGWPPAISVPPPNRTSAANTACRAEGQ